MSTDQIAAVLAAHKPSLYFAAEDGHRECYCGHVMRPGESLEQHLSELLAEGVDG